jgi:hypothetical protein
VIRNIGTFLPFPALRSAAVMDRAGDIRNPTFLKTIFLES